MKTLSLLAILLPLFARSTVAVNPAPGESENIYVSGPLSLDYYNGQALLCNTQPWRLVKNAPGFPSANIECGSGGNCDWTLQCGQTPGKGCLFSSSPVKNKTTGRYCYSHQVKGTTFGVDGDPSDLGVSDMILSNSNIHGNSYGALVNGQFTQFANWTPKYH
ncbi:uncharacterized protein PFL1_05879 [Pseudozyma flocculosa PF-1]|uniref:Uncharacterized protein n=1 Tax=Pseudozyma flocculosa PF-1 TaxID=1277687 RepID=A0A061H1P8_9BASI|nr:uncharacterized protein PFL1_05879 [Pseudozyma flocculosa PF-1]EPQ26557.1 hypothetical protein PFL1_05879 [Pseudozyma flocculosa PF-1]